jgi:hypothetical protein
MAADRAPEIATFAWHELPGDLDAILLWAVRAGAESVILAPDEQVAVVLGGARRLVSGRTATSEECGRLRLEVCRDQDFTIDYGSDIAFTVGYEAAGARGGRPLRFRATVRFDGSVEFTRDRGRP